METTDIERELEELETRMERLRALYEQYFMGIERLEPSIPRKDVDRRIWMMRREQIRNTGLRFKFQMLVQRYSTFQQYWGRTTREIENGTYRRDVLRAAKRFGQKEALTIVGRKRADRYRVLADKGDDKIADAEAAAAESVDVDVDDDDAPTPPSRRALPMPEALGLSWGGRPSRLPGPTHPAGFSVVPPAGPAAGGSVPPLPEAPGAVPQPAASARAGSGTDPDAARRRVAAMAAQMRAERMQAAAQPGSGLDLDLESPASRRAAPSERVPVPGGRHRSSPPSPRPSGKMNAVQTPVVPTEGPVTRPAPAARPDLPGPPVRQPPPSGSPSAPPLPPPRTPGVSASPPRAPHAPPAASAGTHDPRSPFAAPPAAAGAHDPRSPFAAPPAAAGAHDPRSPFAAPPAAAGAHDPRSPFARPPLVGPRPAAPVKPPGNQELDDQRLRQIYAKYVEAKRAAKESTAGVTFEKLAESLKAQAAKLKITHATKTVDYDVVVKDGKTVLKPILR